MERLEPKIIARARVLVETTAMPLTAIARETGISAQALGKQAKAGSWVRPSSQPPRHVIIARLWQSVAQNLESIEAQLREGQAAAALRDLAVLTKIMRDLAVLGSEIPDGSAPPRPPDDLRAEIALRLQRLQVMEEV